MPYVAGDLRHARRHRHLTDDIQSLLPDLERLDSLMPQLQAMLPPQIETMKRMQDMMLEMHSTQSSQQDQQHAMSENQSAMGDAFNDSHNDDTFYLPPEIFDNKDFKPGMKNFISPDGHAVRFIISHENDPLGADGIERIDDIKNAAFEAIKGTPLEGSRVYLGGTASTFKDMRDGNNYDLLIAGVSALALIFIVMLLITRSVVAAGVIVGTVMLSLGASFGLSVLFWQHLMGLDLRVHGDGDGGHHPVGSRRGLQPAVGGSDEGGDTGRDQHRNHPRHGRQRIRRDRGGPGVRVHHDVDVGERHGRGRPDGHDHRDGSVVRHLGDPGVHDAVHRGASRPMVLVAAAGASSTGAGEMVARRRPSRCNYGQAAGWLW